LAHAHGTELDLRMRIELNSAHAHGTIVGLRMRIGQIVIFLADFLKVFSIFMIVIVILSPGLAHAHGTELDLRMRIELNSAHAHGTIVGLRMRIGQNQSRLLILFFSIDRSVIIYDHCEHQRFPQFGEAASIHDIRGNRRDAAFTNIMDDIVSYRRSHKH
ncbi:unnamed protein product, partial [Trichogramma brassicae]